MNKTTAYKQLLVAAMFSLLAIAGYTQQNTKQIKPPLTEWRPIFYIDSLEMPIENFHLYLAPNDVLSIKVEKYIDSTRMINGKLYITSKNPHKFYMLSMSDVVSMYGIEPSERTIYMIDNQFIKNIETFRIDMDFLLNVEVLKASEFTYLKDTIPDLTIFKIITRTKANIEELGRVRIRGTETVAK